MRALSEMCAGASALAILAACITWGAEIGVPWVRAGTAWWRGSTNSGAR